MTLDSRHTEMGKHLTSWIDALAPSGRCGIRIDGPRTRDLIALLVACRATLGVPAPVTIDLTADDYTVGGAP